MIFFVAITAIVKDYMNHNNMRWTRMRAKQTMMIIWLFSLNRNLAFSNFSFHISS